MYLGGPTLHDSEDNIHMKICYSYRSPTQHLQIGGLQF